MSEMVSVEDTEENLNDHVPHSVGGIWGHLFRRLIHLGMLIIPIIYYWEGALVSSFTGLEPKQIVSVCAFAIILSEVIRLRIGIVVFGQREYESNQLSAFFWGGTSVCLTLIIAPEEGMNGAAYGVPLILSLTLIDPLLGELRRANVSPGKVVICGYLSTLAIWIYCGYWLDTPYIIAPFVSALVVASEWPRLTWIDDNATMLLIPLGFVMLLSPFL